MQQLFDKESLTNAVVFLSCGVDSLLTLYFVREQNKEVPVVVFSADWSRAQMKQLERLIFEWDLTAYIYPPNNRYFIGEGERMSLVDEYIFGAVTFPVVRDVEKGTKCAFSLDAQRHEGFNLGWDTVFTGNLSSDTHFSGIPALSRKSETVAGGIRFIAPLHRWTKSAVIRTARSLQIDKYVIEDSGDIALADCFNGECGRHGKVDYDGKAMLKAFQEKYFEG